MIKISRKAIKDDFFYEFSSSAGRYLDIVKYNGNYYAIEPNTGIAYVKGKELKGYLGDILYFQYDGVKYGTGNYYLKSDRHGIVCRWKDDESEVKRNENLCGDRRKKS